MIRKILLPTIFILLTYGFWLSPDFKVITAGVAIFLFGMLALEEGIKAFTGGVLESILRRSTNKLWKSISFGFFTTSLMQSSSLVSVITISFLSAELITLAAGIGIIFGANLGTTTGAWLIAAFGLKVKLSAYAMPMLVFGVVLIFQKLRLLKGLGYILAGLGFLLLGIHYMKDGFEAFKESLDLAKYAITGYPGLFAYALIGIMATVIMQSSHATLVLVLTALAVQQISYENALALAIGSNVGTTITAILGAIGANVQGRRLATAHLVFNVVTGLIAIIFINQLILFVDWIANSAGMEKDNYTLKLAVFHTIFNVLGIILMVPFIHRLVSFLERVIKVSLPHVERPRYLSQASAAIPDAAIEAVRKETVRLYDMAVDVITHGLSLDKKIISSGADINSIINHSSHIRLTEDIDEVYDRRIKAVYAAIVEFTTRAQGTMSAEQVDKLFLYRDAGYRIVESIKGIKHLQKNLKVYLTSNNTEIRQEYNNIRIQICQVLKELRILQSNEDDSATVLSLDQLKLAISERDDISHKGVDKLIRNNHISAQMAISLMNDSAYCQSICRNLLSIGASLFVSKNKNKRDAENRIALDDTEINEILTKRTEKANG
ncbi:Na/Pi cotransporter family protein [Colwelliaceae bacterium 6471]